MNTYSDENLDDEYIIMMMRILMMHTCDENIAAAAASTAVIDIDVVDDENIDGDYDDNADYFTDVAHDNVVVYVDDTNDDDDDETELVVMEHQVLIQAVTTIAIFDRDSI